MLCSNIYLVIQNSVSKALSERQQCALIYILKSSLYSATF